MPYKNPEHKRQWEQNNRKQRNAQRRNRYAASKGSPSAPRRPLDPVDPNGESPSMWKLILGVAVGAAILIGALVGDASGYSDGGR
jgi:hypothetical protein